MAGKSAARDLSYFVLRSQALSQYRRAVRCVRQAPTDVRGALHLPWLHPAVAGNARSHSLRRLCVVARLTRCLCARACVALCAEELMTAVRQAAAPPPGGAPLSRDQWRFALSEGRLQLKRLNEMLGLTAGPAADAECEGDGCGHSHSHDR